MATPGGIGPSHQEFQHPAIHLHTGGTVTVSLHFVHYNFCQVHCSLKATPALVAGIADHRWTLEELVEAPY